jgi:tripartite-type tricarboxylate transporter receptor subunit TctC
VSAARRMSRGYSFKRKPARIFQLVPCRGAAAMMQDLLAGQIDLMIDFAANSLPKVRAGTIKAYAVTAPTRLPAAPDIPTVDEAGLPGLYVSAWQGIWAPKRTPKDVVGRLNTAVVGALADPSVRQRLADLGQEIYPRDQQTKNLGLGDRPDPDQAAKKSIAAIAIRAH